MADDDLRELLASVEVDRAATRPLLDAEFCRRVVLIEQEHADDGAAAMEAIQRVAEEMIKTGEQDGDLALDMLIVDLARA